MIILIALQAVLVACISFALAWSMYVSTKKRRVYISSLSSGVSSSVATDRAIQRYGLGDVVTVFMDTLWEDDDNYRFLAECECYWGVPTVRITEGRTPLQVAHDEHIIPNQKIAPCTKRLKIIPFVAYCETWQRAEYDVTIILGMDWKETHRMDAPLRNYGARGMHVEYPLMWKPYDASPFDTVRGWGIEPPRMYRQGYSHANCGGRCVKQGKGDWKRTHTHYPARFEEVAMWEALHRHDPVLADYALLRDQRDGVVSAMSLYELEQTWETGQLDMFTPIEDDTSYCFCNAGDPGPVAAR